MPENANTDRPPTLKDVAAHVNLSRQTISRVINNKGEVSDATRQRVLDAIREVGYYPNSLARSLVTNRTQVIGLAVPNIDHPYFPLIARGVEDAASDLDYGVFLCNAAGSNDRELRALRRLRGNRVDGVISFNSHLTDAEIQHTIGKGCPALLVNPELPGEHNSVVWPGYEQGGQLATKHLIDGGRRKIAFLGPAYESNVDASKLHGFRQALTQAGIDVHPDRIIPAAHQRGLGFMDHIQSGYQAAERIIEEGIQIDGIFATNDLPAIGAIRALLAHGVRVPEDVAVIGFGSSDVSGIVTPELSTVTMPLHEIGEAAFQALLDRIHNGNNEVHTINIEPILIIRQSSAG